MPDGEKNTPKITAVYSPLRLNWRNVALGTVIALLIVSIGVFAFTYSTPISQQNQQIEIKSGTPSAKTSKETANWRTYTNSKYKYSIKYPEALKPIYGGGVSGDSPALPIDEVALVAFTKTSNQAAATNFEYLDIYVTENVKKDLEQIVKSFYEENKKDSGSITPLTKSILDENSVYTYKLMGVTSISGLWGGLIFDEPLSKLQVSTSKIENTVVEVIHIPNKTTTAMYSTFKFLD